MSKTARRLGRGLESLVPNLRQPKEQGGDRSDNSGHGAAFGGGQVIGRDSSDGRGFEVTIDLLSPNPLQPRRNMVSDALERLAASIRECGLLQPIAVRRNGAEFQIIAGERRWRAARLAGLKSVPAIVREATDEQMLEFALLENIQREDLGAIDRAKAYREYCDRFGARPEELADRLGEDRTTVINYLRLLELDEEIQLLVALGQLSMGHARALLGVTDRRRQVELARRVSDRGMSVRALESFIRAERSSVAPVAPSAKAARAERDSAHLRDITRRFEEVLKTKVKIIEGRRRNSGKIVIKYYSLDDFDRVAEALGVRVE